jgi:hypothetical protein
MLVSNVANFVRRTISLGAFAILGLNDPVFDAALSFTTGLQTIPPASSKTAPAQLTTPIS